MTSNLVHQKFNISRKDRNRQNEHASFVVWFTGLSGSGKSTLANELDKLLNIRGLRTYILDGDNIRKGISSDLDFTDKGRKENIRRSSEIAKLMVDAGLIVIASFISPLEVDRALARTIIGDQDFIQIYLSCSLSVCEKRDVKGFYSKARNGEIKNFTGIHSLYEIPMKSDININSGELSVEECLDEIMFVIHEKLNVCKV